MASNDQLVLVVPFLVHHLVEEASVLDDQHALDSHLFLLFTQSACVGGLTLIKLYLAFNQSELIEEQ